MYFLKFFFKAVWVDAIKDSRLTMSINLFIGSYPILLITSLSILTSWVCRKGSSIGLLAVVFNLAWNWCGLYELVPNSRVCVAPNPVPILIFLFMLTISSVNPIYFSLSSSLYMITLSAAILRIWDAFGLCSSSFDKQF